MCWRVRKDGLGRGCIYGEYVEGLCDLPEWIWRKAEKPESRHANISDVIDYSLPYDKDEVFEEYQCGENDTK